MKVKVDIVTSDDIKIYYTGKFQDFTARYIIKICSIKKVFLCSIPLSGILESSIVNPFPAMPILGFSNSKAKKDMMSKYGQMGTQLSD